MSELKVGDRVTVLPTSSLERYIGKSGVISDLDWDGDPHVLIDGNKHGLMFYARNVKKEEQKMKVGQKVTVVGQQYPEMKSIGYTGVITRDDGSPRPYEVDSKWWYNADELKEVKGMNKSELKTGMLVQLTDEQWYIVMRNHGCTGETEDILINSDGGFIYLRRYNDDLSYNGNYPDKYSITRIATYDYLHHIFRGQKIEYLEQLQGFKLLWQRENPKKQQLTELVDKLRGQLKKATDELEAM